MPVPSRRFTTTVTGDDNLKPVAVLATSSINALIGAIIQLDGRKSYDPEKRPLVFRWRFTQVPIGSAVETAGFKDIRPNSTAVSFIPDKTGVYVVELVVSDGDLDSAPVTASVNIQLTRVPVGENLVPDLSFLWSYISDFWNLVEDREKITTIWSSVVQLIGADLIKLWSNDYNKSLETIQPTYQRRWQAFSMVTDLSGVVDQRVIVGKTDSGVGGTSGNIGATPGTGNTAVFYLPRGRVGDGDKTDFTILKGNYGPKGRVIVIDGSTYTIARVQNQDQSIASGTDLVTVLGSNVVSSASLGGAQVGDVLAIKSGPNTGSYRVKVLGSGSATLVYPADPPGGPFPSFQNGTAISFTVVRQFSSVVVSETAIPDGLVGASWRVPHLLHAPNLDLEAAGVRAGDVLVFDVTRADIGLTTEVQAQVVGADRDRLGFEFTVQTLDPSVNEGSAASVVESGGVVTVSGLQNMRPLSVGGYLEILNGDNPGTYKIRQYVSEDAVVIDNKLASGPDSGNPSIQWVERAKTGSNVERALFQKIVRDLRIVPASAGDQDVSTAAEVLISFMPMAINLNTRPFSKFGITFRAKKVIHNTAIKVPDELIGAPVLQESVVDPPVVLRENLDYLIESGYLTFVSDLFSLSSPAPETLWSECTIFDNSAVVERNFGRLVSLSRDDLSQKNTRAPYLSAVKGLFFAYTNGPTMANLRLGLQILLGLPFSEERGLVLEVQNSFSVDSDGNPLGRMLVEDISETGARLGTRRIYLFSGLVGLETNPATLVPYAAGDTIERFAPVSKGVEVLDYVKDPLWWQRSLYGLEILKYFTFKVVVDSQVFNNDDVQFALEFINAIKPTYTKILSAAALSLSDDIIVSDSVGGHALLKFYSSPWGYEATNRTNDQNQQGANLWNVGSYPFATRSLHFLTDVQTHIVSGQLYATSLTGWDMSLLRATQRDAVTGNPFDEGRLPTVEGDILAILAGQPGASDLEPGLYVIDEVVDSNNLRLGPLAGSVDQDLQEVGEVTRLPLNLATFLLGSDLKCCILRREVPTVLVGTDLVTDGTNIVQSATAKFLKNNVRVGDLLCVEDGANLGEYLIDALVNQGTGATVGAPVGVFSTVTGLTGMTLGSVNGTLELVWSGGQGVFRIVGYVDPTSVRVRSVPYSGSAVTWRETPRPPYIQEDRVALKLSDGSPANLASGSLQKFRVVRAGFYRPEIYAMRFWYSASPLEYVLEGRHYGYGNSLDGEWRDLFTPGMVGLPLNVSESINPVNDGEFIITRYINSGRVAVSSSSVTSEATRGQKVNLRRAP